MQRCLSQEILLNKHCIYKRLECFEFVATFYKLNRTHMIHALRFFQDQFTAIAYIAYIVYQGVVIALQEVRLGVSDVLYLRCRESGRSDTGAAVANYATGLNDRGDTLSENN